MANSKSTPNVAIELVGAHISDEDAERFWSKVTILLEDECWPWKAKSKKRRGYGQFKWNGKQLAASRMAYALTHASAPAGILVMHTCDNPPCCNPLHLILGTHKDNTQDMLLKGRSKFVPCNSRHFNIGKWRATHLSSKGSLHPGAKLNEEQARRIKAELARGVRGIDIAKAFGCSVHTVSNINRGKQWKHV